MGQEIRSSTLLEGKVPLLPDISPFLLKSLKIKDTASPQKTKTTLLTVRRMVRSQLYKFIFGESDRVNTAVVEEWMEKTLPSLVCSYSKTDIFNADETGLFFNLFPDIP